MRTKQTSKSIKKTPQSLISVGLRFIATFSLAMAVIATAVHWSVLISTSISLNTMNATGASFIEGADMTLNDDIAMAVDVSSRIVMTWVFVSLLASAIMLFVASDRKMAARCMFTNLAWLSACVISAIFSQAILRSILSSIL